MAAFGLPLRRMRIHHLNCISSCPLGGRLMDRRTTSVLQRGRLCCHCLLAETSQGLVLVDTGFGLNDVRQLQRLGFRPEDVRHIVLTHLDFDHADMDPDDPRCTPGLRLDQALMEQDRRAHLADQQRLRELRRTHSAAVRVPCAHDPTEFEQRAGRSAGQPAGPA